MTTIKLYKFLQLHPNSDVYFHHKMIGTIMPEEISISVSKVEAIPPKDKEKRGKIILS